MGLILSLTAVRRGSEKKTLHSYPLAKISKQTEKSVMASDWLANSNTFSDSLPPFLTQPHDQPA